MISNRISFGFFLSILLLPAIAQGQQEPVVDYAKEVKPFFEKYCNGCHSAETLEAGIQTDHSDLENGFIDNIVIYFLPRSMVFSTLIIIDQPLYLGQLVTAS